MVKEVYRRCTNPREDDKNYLVMKNNKGYFKLFGVQIPVTEVIHKSLNITNLDNSGNGYVSNGFVQNQNGRKKATPGTMEERHTSEEQKTRASVFDAPPQNEPIVILEGNGQQKYVDISWIQPASYSHEPMATPTMFPDHQAWMYMPHTHVPCHASSSSTAIDQTPEAEAAKICISPSPNPNPNPSPSATVGSVNLDLKLGLP